MSLFRQLATFFSSGECVAEPGEEHPLLQRVALLLEAAAYDDEFSPEERRKITSLLTVDYGLAAEEITPLLAMAKAKTEAATDLYDLSRDLRKSLSGEDRSELMYQLWQVILADGVIHPNEDLFARKMQKLLRLDMPTWVQARSRARARLEREKTD